MFCRSQLVRLTERAPEIREGGAWIGAISVDPPDVSRKLAFDLGPGAVPLYSDPSRAVIRAFGVYDVDHDIALPAILVFDRERQLAWKYVADSVLDRPEEDQLVEVVRGLGPD